MSTPLGQLSPFATPIFVAPPVAPQDFRISSAGKAVLSSGSVQTFDNSGLEFSFSNLTFVMKFLSGAPGAAASMEIKQASASALEIKLFNFDSSIGTGTTAPIEVGTY